MDNLEKLQQERNTIINKINNKKQELEGNYLKDVKIKIDTVSKQNFSLISDLKNTQNSLIINLPSFVPQQIKNMEEKMIDICSNISKNDKIYKELLQEYNSKELLILNNTNYNKIIQDDINLLLEQLKQNTEKIAQERENIRQQEIKDKKKNKIPSTNPLKIYIDEELGIYIWYDKIGVISTTMKCLFSSADNIDEKTLEYTSFKNKDNMYSEISNIKVPGLPTILSIFIDIVIKSLGQYAKSFFFFKNTIDLIAGLELGELFGNSLPALGEILADLKLFFSNTNQWMFKHTMSPLFDSNTPIPEFLLDLGTIIPILPFKISIPEIDPYGFFKNDTPFNVNTPNDKINSNFLTNLISKNDNDDKENSEKFEKDKKIKISEINQKIINLKLDINNISINNILEQIKKNENYLKVLINQYDKLKKDLDDNNKKYNYQQLIQKENDLVSLCQKIKEIKDLLVKLDRELISKRKQDKNKLQEELNNLLKSIEDLQNSKFTSTKDLSKLAIKLKFQQNLNLDNDKMVKTLRKLQDNGVDIFNNTNLDYIQKIGYNYKNEKYLDRLLQLPKYSVKLNDVDTLNMLYQIGFNLNDSNYLRKLQLLTNYLKLSNINNLKNYIDLGFNINNPGSLNILKILYEEYKINLNDNNIIIKLSQLGFNFNNPNMINRLKTLKKYIDITSSIGLNNALSKNVNLNNPYFEEILKRYNNISLNFNSENFQKTSQEILSTINVNDINRLLELFNYYKIDNKNIHVNKYFINNVSFSSLPDLNEFITRYNLSSNINDYQYFYERNLIEDNYLETDTMLYQNGEVFLKFLTEYAILYYIPITKLNLNKYQKYGIYLPLVKNQNIEYINNNYISDDTPVLKIKGVYPNDDNILRVNNINDKTEYEYKLLILKDFIINNGSFVINNIKIDQNINTNDLNYLASKSNLTIVNDINLKINETNYDILKGVYGNFDKLGLNIRDNNFEKKYDDLLTIFNVKIEESVLLETKRKVFLKYYDNDNNLKSMELSSTVKPEPTIYEDPRTEIQILNYLDSSNQKPETKTILKFDCLNLIGFNFQKDNYFQILQKLKGLNFNLNNFQTTYDTFSLINIGFHFSSSNAFYLLDEFVKIGFNFKINDSNIKVNNEEINISTTLASKLNSLNSIGFNFQKGDCVEILHYLKDIGINIQNSDFENAMSELFSLGIDFNDSSWKDKLTKIKNMKINFSDSSWKDAILNLITFGIDFNDDNWLLKYNKYLKLKELGLNILDSLLRKKLSLLSSMGVDFTKPEDDYMQKIESLIQIGLINIPNDIRELKKQRLEYNQKKLYEINLSINNLKKELNGDYLNNINKEINQCEKNINIYVFKINDNKEKAKTSSNLIQIKIELEEYCEKLKTYELKLNSLNIKKQNYRPKTEEYILNKIKDYERLKLIINREQVYKLNKNLIFNDLDKFEAFSGLGVNFNDANWNKDIQNLKNNGLNFNNNNWNESVTNNENTVKKNPVVEWIKGIIKMISTILSVPLKIIFNLIKKLIDLIKQVILIPLNPLDIPKWAVGIIKMFKEYLDLMKSMVTIEGLKDFLFFSPLGLTLIDLFIPGFNDFSKRLKNKIKTYKSKVKYLDDFIDTKSKYLIELKKNNSLEKNKILEQIKIKESILNNNIKSTYADINLKNNTAITVLKNMIDNTKNMIKNQNLSIDKLRLLEQQLKEYCKSISTLENNIKENDILLNSYLKIPKDDLKNDINILNNKLNNLNDKEIEDIERQIKLAKEQRNDLLNKYNKLQDMCAWSKNIDLIIEIIMEMDEDIKNESNPYDNNIKNNLNRVTELKKERDLLLSQLNNNTYNINLNDLNKKKNDIDNNINILEKKLCSERFNMDDYTFSSILKNLDDLKKLRKEILNQLKIAEILNGRDINKIKKRIGEINLEIEKLEKQNNNLKLQSDEFNKNKNSRIKNLNKIKKWLPVIINIICCPPKFLVNIIIGIFNAIAYMRNLPTLWEFPYVE
jgi:hypothetical protein